MKKLVEIQNTLLAHKKELFNNYPIKSLAIFGSYSRNSATEESDLDLLAEFESPIGVRFIDLADELEELTGLKVDLVSKNGIKKKYWQYMEPELIYV